VLQAESLGTDPRYATNADRVQARETLVPTLASLMAEWHRDELLQELERVGVPAGPINTVSDVFADPQVVFRKMRVDLPAPGSLGDFIPTVRTPIRFSAASLELGRPSPRLGEHTWEVKQQIAEHGWPALPQRLCVAGAPPSPARRR
jgi:crotonobetainyl-CoA:carnitine CoA-transferase CaiB-like acyl-CoA transferase